MDAMFIAATSTVASNSMAAGRDATLIGLPLARTGVRDDSETDRAVGLPRLVVSDRPCPAVMDALGLAVKPVVPCRRFRKTC